MSWISRLSDKIMFTCLWIECNGYILTLSEFRCHFRDHLKEKFSDGGDGEENCPIKTCSFTSTKDRLRRHLCMHEFHAVRQYAAACFLFRKPKTASLTTCGHPEYKLVYEGDAMICEWDGCTVCFGVMLSFFDHIDMHVMLSIPTVEERWFRCEWQGCTARFKKRTALRRHVAHHSGNKTAACPFCGTFLSTFSKLCDHVLRRNIPESNDEEMRCSFCFKMFDSARLLREHCERHVMTVICKHCHIMFASKCDLNRHIIGVHMNRKTNICETCGKRFASVSDLVKHRAVHTDTLSYECSKCYMKFRWLKQLTRHERMHEQDQHKQTYLCHLCPAKYKDGSILSRHLKKKHMLCVPVGFNRFQYKKCADGFFRLQTKRCLSQGLIEELGDGHEDVGAIQCLG